MVVRKLLKGERTAGVLTFCGIGAVVCLCVASISLTIAYISATHDFKNTLFDRCETRLTFDKANHASIGADVELYRTILKQNDSVPVSAIPPEFRQLARDQRATIQKALVAKETAFAGSIPADCAALKK